MLSASGAGAQTWTLAWARGAGAESCIDGPALARAVEQRLGRAPFGGGNDWTFLLEGLVQKTPTGWSAFVAIRDRNGATLGVREHQSDAAKCAALDEPLALIVTLLIDLSGGSPVTAELRPAAPPPAPVVPVPAPAPAAAPVEPLPVELGVLPTLGVGQLSDATPGLRVEASTRLAHVGATLALEGWWPTRQSLGSGTARLSQVALEVGGCPLHGSAKSFELRACANALAGVLWVQGQGFAVNHSSSSPVVDLGARATVSRAVGADVALTLGLGARAHLLRTRVGFVDEAGEFVSIARGLPLAVDVAAGVTVRLR